MSYTRYARTLNINDPLILINKLINIIKCDNKINTELGIWFSECFKPDNYANVTNFIGDVRYDDMWNRVLELYNLVVGLDENKMYLYEYISEFFDIAYRIDETSHQDIIKLCTEMNLNFIGKLKEEGLVKFIINTRIELLNLAKQEESIENISIALNYPIINSSTMDYILGHKIDITFDMLKNIARYHPNTYFENCFLRLSDTSFDNDKINELLAMIILSNELTKKINFLVMIIKYQKINNFKITEKCLQIVLDDVDKLKNNIGVLRHISKWGIQSKFDNILSQIIININYLCKLKNFNNIFILNLPKLNILIRIFSRQFYKNTQIGFCYVDDYTKKMLRELNQKRSSLGKSDIIGNYELMKYYFHDYRGNRFPIDIKFKISMTELENICDLESVPSLIKMAYSYLEPQVSPSTKCLENITKYKTYQKSLDFLLSVNGILSIKCIENILSHYKTKKYDDIKYIVTTYAQDQRNNKIKSLLEYKTNSKVSVIKKKYDKCSPDDKSNNLLLSI
jgi:hypothetical protein